MSVCLSACGTVRVPLNGVTTFDSAIFTKICRNIPIFIKSLITGTLHEDLHAFSRAKLLGWGFPAGESHVGIPPTRCRHYTVRRQMPYQRKGH
jgi:hypothetical protein